MEGVHASVGGSDQRSPWKGGGRAAGAPELSAPCCLLPGTAALPKGTGPEERGWHGGASAERIFVREKGENW